MPKIANLEGPLRERQVSMEVLRMHPLSITLTREGFEPMIEVVVIALSALYASRDKAA